MKKLELINNQDYNKMAFVPTYDRLLVEPNTAEETTVSGLVLPRGDSVKTCKGKVLKVGKGHLMPDYNFRECEHKVGDIVVYYKHDAAPITVGQKEYHILKDTCPFGTLVEEVCKK